MTFSDLMDIPRFYTALAEWGSCFLYLLLLKKTTMHSYIPFAPFLTGAIFFMLQYDNIFIF